MADNRTDLFVKTDSGSVAVIDPDKATEVRRLSLSTTGLCQGIGAGGMVWSCDTTPSGDIDDVPRVQCCGTLVHAASDEVWVVTGSDVVAMERERLEETARISIEGTPCAVAVDGDRVFVSGTQPLLTGYEASRGPSEDRARVARRRGRWRGIGAA
jgi:hypothetical protein